MTILVGNIQGSIVIVLMGIMMAIFALAYFFILTKCLKRNAADEMIVRTGIGGPVVTNHATFVVPYLHQYDRIPVTVQKLSYERTADSPLIFRCGTKATLTADLMLRVNPTTEDALRAVSSLGISRLKDPQALREYFASIFNDSLETIALQTDFLELAKNKNAFREKLIDDLGTDLNGMVVGDICIHHLDSTAS